MLLTAGGVYANGGQGIAVVNTEIYGPDSVTIISDTGENPIPTDRMKNMHDLACELALHAVTKIKERHGQHE